MVVHFLFLLFGPVTNTVDSGAYLKLPSQSDGGACVKIER